MCSVLLVRCVLGYVSGGQESPSLKGAHLFLELNPHCLAEAAELVILILSGNFGHERAAMDSKCLYHKCVLLRLSLLQDVMNVILH